MEFFEVIEKLVSSVGFPILAYLLMVKTNTDQQAAHKEEVQKMNDAFEKRMESLQANLMSNYTRLDETLERNTDVLSALKNLLEVKG